MKSVADELDFILFQIHLDFRVLFLTEHTQAKVADSLSDIDWSVLINVRGEIKQYETSY